MDLLSMAGRGNTSLQPISAAEYGMPQALTWNIGTTGSTESRADKHITAGKAAAEGRSVGGRRGESGGVGGGVAGVAHAGGGVLVEPGPCIVRRLRADPVLIAQKARDAGVCRQPVCVAQGHPMLDARAF